MDVPDGTANLGIKIANIGADAAKQQLASIGAVGDAAGSKVSAAFIRTQSDAQKLGTQLAALSQITSQWGASGETARGIATSLAAAIESEGLMASATAEQIAALAAAQATMTRQTAQVTDATRAMTLTQMQAIEMNEALATSNMASGAAMEGHGFQAGRLRQDLGSLIGRLTGTNLAVDRVGSAFGAMAIGNVAIIGVLIAVAAIIEGYDKLSLSLKGVTADQEKAIESFEKAQRLKEAGGATGVANTGLQNNIGAYQTQVADLQAQIAAMGPVNTTSGGAGTNAAILVGGLDQTVIDSRKKRLDELVALQHESQQKLNDEMQKAELQANTHYANDLATLVKAKDATAAQHAQALALEQSYFTAAAELAAAGQTKIAAEYAKLAESLKAALGDTPAQRLAADTDAAKKSIDTTIATIAWESKHVDLIKEEARQTAILAAARAAATKAAVDAQLAEETAASLVQAQKYMPSDTASIGIQTGMSGDFETHASAIQQSGIVARENTANVAAAAQDKTFRDQQEKAWTKYYEDLSKGGETAHLEMLKEMQRDLSSFFDTVFTGGSNVFQNLWDNVKKSFLKMISDILAADAMQKLAKSSPDAFGGGNAKSNNATTGSGSGSGNSVVSSIDSAFPVVGAVLGVVLLATGLASSQNSAMKQASAQFLQASVNLNTFITGLQEQNKTQSQQTVDSVNAQFGAQLSTEMTALNTLLSKQGISIGGYVFNQQGHGNVGRNLAEGDITDPSQLPRLIQLLTAAQGTGVNVAADRGLKQTLADLTALNAQYQQTVALTQANLAAAQADENTNLKVRLLRTQGNTVAADALALQLQQQQEYADAVKAGYDASTLALLTQVQAQEKLTAATNGANAAALNMVSGYKVQAAIFGAMAAHSSTGALLPLTSPAPMISSAASGGDLTVTLVMPDGTALGTTVLKDFKKRAQRKFGDTTRWSEVQ